MARRNTTSEETTSLAEETTAAAGETAAQEKIQTIEEWAKAKKTDQAVVAGVKALKHWNSGKSLSEEQYDTAVGLFEKGPARRERG